MSKKKTMYCVVEDHGYYETAISYEGDSYEDCKKEADKRNELFPRIWHYVELLETAKDTVTR